MKRVLIKILICIFALSTCLFALSACNRESGYYLNCYVDGELYKSVAIMENKGFVQMPSDPEKNGYDFTGWFLDNGTFSHAFGVNYLKNGTTKDVDVYAKFEAVYNFENGVIKGLTTYARKNLSVINVPEHIAGVVVKEITDSAFVANAKLTAVNIPKTVISIGNGAFAGCVNLTKLDVEDGNPVYHADENCVFETDTLTMIAGCAGSTIPIYALAIGNNALYNLPITSIAIPKAVHEIGDSAFECCSKLQSVSFATDIALESIGKNAFKDCSKLQGITLNSGLKALGAGAFDGCRELASITIPNTVISVGNSAFKGCEKLAEVLFEDQSQLVSLGNGAFRDCVSLSAFCVPNGVLTINTDTFFGCTKLKTVTFEDGCALEKIGDWAFANCKELETFTLLGTLKAINNDAFNGCEKLGTIQFLDSVETFSQISLGENWALNVPANQIVCQNGKISLS